MSRPKTGIQLPQALREQIDGDNSENARRGKRLSRSKLSRKEARKQERFEKKQRKASFYSTGAAAKRRAPEDHPDSPSRKRTKTAESTTASAVSQSREAKSNPAIALAQQPTKPPKEPSKKTAPKDTAVKPKPKPKAKPKPKSALQKLAEGSRSGGLPRSQVDRDEEAYIAYLEAKLGMRKGAKRKDGLDEDGLDDLMEGLDNIAGPSKYSSEEETSARSESEDDGSTDGSASKEDSEENDDLKSTGVNVEPSQDVARDDLPQSSERDVVPTEQQQPTARYIPPHLRKNLQSSSDAEAIAKLMRQLKGLLNKLSEPNIASILDDIEELYRKHRRHDITETLTTLIVNGITSHASMLDAFIVLNAALVSALYKIIGIEFAAFFVQNVVSTYDTHYTALSTSDGMVEDETKGKECSNLIVLLSELYNFQVVSCVLVYDIIRTLLDGDLSEMDVELLLKLLRNSGQQLRQDDPLALKDIVQTVQNKVSASSGSSSSRTRFMIETLINLKNNKTKRAATQHAGGDSAETLKRFLSGLGKKRHLAAHDPLRVTLADLQSADSRGKWWLVGAAWGGDPLAERQHAAPRAAPASDAESALLKLAKKQGMNTDIRRNVFVVLMSSDDYVDACERLAQLNLTEIQQREIVRVILHCCSNENTYNPYYTLIGQRLAHQSHSHKITLQFCLWDFLREMGETSVGGVELIKSLGPDGAFAVTDTSSVSSSRRRNLARAYAWWLARDVVTLTILKPLEFLSLKPSTRKFVQALLDRVFFDSQTSTLVLSDRLSDLPAKRDRGAIEEVFIKAARAPALAAGLAYFLAEMQKAREGEEDDDKGGNFYTWAYDVAIDTLRTGADVLQAL